MQLELTKQFQKVLETLENTNKSVFITGKAGTGKSTLLKHFCETTKKNYVVLAPTGVAAINVGGETIHSFFKFKIDYTIQDITKAANKLSEEAIRLYEKIETIIIDEISMVRADIMDFIDIFLRRVLQNDSPFGGKQLIFFGDLYQLPPVVKSDEREHFKEMYNSHYFFESKAIKEFLNTKLNEFEYIELDKIFRQTDNEFIQILNAIRNNTITEEMLTVLNKRFDPNSIDILKNDNAYVYLSSTNTISDEINLQNLESLKGRPKAYYADIKGDFTSEKFPTEEKLVLKVGARVMLLNNDSMGCWVNGTIATVLELHNDYITVTTENDEAYDVEAVTWETVKTIYDSNTKSITKDKIGSFKQIPVRLAWAITIHKSQGKTFNKVIVDMGKSAFAQGQTYVALSRCKTLEGIVIARELRKSDVRVSYDVVKFVTKLQYVKSQVELLDVEKISMIKEAIEKKQKLEISYLKSRDEKSKRIIIPKKIHKTKYQDLEFLALDAYCTMRNDDRVFNIEKILSIRIV